jgi:peptidoglycan hydrolase-like protein with peptidoglycan-binding domain
MEIGMRKLIIATASVLAIGIGGIAVGDAAGTINNRAAVPATAPQHGQTIVDLSKDDVRQAQLELRHLGLYNGSLDGVIGPQTKRALAQFQKDNRLQQTGTLDQLTMETMFGNLGIGQGSSTPPNSEQGAGHGGDSITPK